MKCPRCRREMKRLKLENHRYVYQCPNCHLRIGTPEGPENKEKEKGLDESI